MTDLQNFNRLQASLWLESRASGESRDGGIPIAGGRYGSYVPLNLKVLDKESTRSTDEYLSRRVEWMKLHWYPWWKVLQELYLGPDADPSQLSRWKNAPKGTPEHDKATKAQKALDLLSRGYQGRLTVPISEVEEGRGDKEREKYRRRIQGLNHYFERLDLGATKGEAARETAEQFGVGLSTVYRWIKWLGED